MSRVLLPLGVLLALACGGLPTAEPEPALVPAPAPEPAGPDLGFYGYAPAPGGAAFSEPPIDTPVFAARPTELLAAPGGAVTAKLPLGAALTVLGPAGEPAELGGFRNRWIRVRTDEGAEGVVFGAELTPLGGATTFAMNENEDRAWTVSFGPDFSPIVRVAAPGGGVLEAKLTPTERFTGGRLDAETVSWGDFETRIQVALCRVDGGEEPACSAATARVTEDSIAQAGPPDPWKYLPDEDAVCATESELAWEPLTAPEPLFTVQTPAYMRGTDGEVACAAVALVTGELHRGKKVVSCVADDGGKTGPDLVAVHTYLVDGDTWIHLSCGAPHGVASDLNASLAERRITVTLATAIRLPEAYFGPETLPTARGTLTRAWMTAAPEGERRPLFDVPGHGGAFALVDPAGATAGKGAVYLARPDGTVALYGWAPGPLTWTGDPPSDRDWDPQTEGCDGTPEWLANVETGVIAEELTPVATADGVPVGVLADPAHPVNQRLYAYYQQLTSAQGVMKPADLPVGLSLEDLLATRPWLFVEDPWGRMVRLMRDDFAIPPMCEPIVYVYADPPVDFRLAPVPPLAFFRAIPDGLDGWSGTAWPDGSVTVDGERWPELFWEGRSVKFPPPAEGVVLRGSEVEPVLRRAAAERGLVGHELDAFVAAWSPRLARHAWVRIGFHDREDIARFAPLSVDPEPDAVIRVMLDASVVDGPAPGALPATTPPERGPYTLVEWGGVLRGAY